MEEIPVLLEISTFKKFVTTCKLKFYFWLSANVKYQFIITGQFLIGVFLAIKESFTLDLSCNGTNVLILY